jgi:hypothetical protein
MKLDKNKRFIYSIDNFLPKEELLNVQTRLLNYDYKSCKNDEVGHFGFGYQVDMEDIKEDPLIKRIKNSFHPQNDLKIKECRAHLRYNTGEPLPHLDDSFNFLLYVKGDPLLNNGTGFYTEGNKLSSHIGFLENRAVFFNASIIWHTNLQSFGESTPRHSLNIFYSMEEII